MTRGKIVVVLNGKEVFLGKLIKMQFMRCLKFLEQQTLDMIGV